MQADTTLWNRCVRDLQAELPEQQFNTWIRPLHAVEEGHVLKLLAPNRFVVDWLQQNYIERILELVDDAGSSTNEVVVEVGSRDASCAEELPPHQQVDGTHVSACWQVAEVTQAQRASR